MCLNTWPVRVYDDSFPLYVYSYMYTTGISLQLHVNYQYEFTVTCYLSDVRSDPCSQESFTTDFYSDLPFHRTTKTRTFI